MAEGRCNNRLSHACLMGVIVKGRKTERKMKRKSLQKSTLIVLVALLLFFCGMFSVSAIVIARNMEKAYQMRDTERSVQSAVATIDASFMNYNYLTRLLMINDRIVSYLKAPEINADLVYEARRGIYEIQNLYSYIDSVYIFRNDGAFVSTGRAEYRIDMECPEHDRILEAIGSTVVSINGNGMIEKNTEEQLLTLARAVYDINSQKLLGMLIMNVSSRYFEDAMEAQGTTTVCILDNKGTVLCGDKRIGSLYHNRYDSEEMVLDWEEIHREKILLAGTKAVEPIIVMGCNDKSKRSFPYGTVFALLLPLTAFVICILCCAWFITVNIAGPLRKLAEGMEKTKSSGWLEEVDAEMPNNEIGNLADSYNTMIEYLNQMVNRLLENEKNVQKAELRVLQEQIKPHFLYNTLETISYMAVQEKADKVHDALETLGNFYRNFLSNGKREIPLKREIRITQDYLALQKLRYGDIIVDEYEVDDRVSDYMVPKLILQPLVENAIYHGIRMKGEEGIIRLTVKQEEDGLYIFVYDTGVGMEQSLIDEILKPSTEASEGGEQGFGLRGTVNRIRYYCNCEDVVKIKSEPGEYTEVMIWFPKKKREKEGGESDVSSHDH